VLTRAEILGDAPLPLLAPSAGVPMNRRGFLERLVSLVAGVVVGDRLELLGRCTRRPPARATSELDTMFRRVYEESRLLVLPLRTPFRERPRALGGMRRFYAVTSSARALT
jgi:hypothetical protein